MDPLNPLQCDFLLFTSQGGKQKEPLFFTLLIPSVDSKSCLSFFSSLPVPPFSFPCPTFNNVSVFNQPEPGHTRGSAFPLISFLGGPRAASLGSPVPTEEAYNGPPESPLPGEALSRAFGGRAQRGRGPSHRLLSAPPLSLGPNGERVEKTS